MPNRRHRYWPGDPRSLRAGRTLSAGSADPTRGEPFFGVTTRRFPERGARTPAKRRGDRPFFTPATRAPCATESSSGLPRFEGDGLDHGPFFRSMAPAARPRQHALRFEPLRPDHVPLGGCPPRPIRNHAPDSSPCCSITMPFRPERPSASIRRAFVGLPLWLQSDGGPVLSVPRRSVSSVPRPS